MESNTVKEARQESNQRPKYDFLSTHNRTCYLVLSFVEGELFKGAF